MATASSPSAARSIGGSIWLTLLAATAAAVVANAVIYLVGQAAGVSFEVAGSAVPFVSVVLATAVWLLLGTLVAGLTVPRWPAARLVLQIVAGVVAVLSLAGLVGADASTGTRVLLGVTHLVVGAFYVGALAYSARAD